MNIIAEIGLSHLGNFETATSLVRRAKEAGANYVKFQIYKTKKFCDPSLPDYDLFKKCELSFDEHSKLRALAKEIDIGYGASTFDRESTEFYKTLRPDFYKIASCEALNKDLVNAYRNVTKPILISAGVVPPYYIHELWGHKINVYCLHCVSKYPTPYDEAKLKMIKIINTKFHGKVGYSDHTIGMEAAKIAYLLGAKYLEKHFCLSSQMTKENMNILRDIECSMTPQDLVDLKEWLYKTEQLLSINTFGPPGILPRKSWDELRTSS